MNFTFFNIAIATSLFVASCTNSSTENKRSDKNGTLALAENTVIATLFPHNMTAQTELIIASQFHEGLLRLDPKTLDISPALAEKWETSADGKTITFHLVKGAHFQNDDCYEGGEGPEITSKDIRFSLGLLCSDVPTNLLFELMMKDRIVGANEMYVKKANSLKGFKIIDDYTFTIELVAPSLTFLRLLAHPAIAIINETAYKKYGENLKNGAGPFIYDATSTPEKIVFVRNPNYYGKDEAGNSLPYLDTVLMNILPSIEDALNLYEANKLDLVNTLPSNRVKQVVEANIKEFSAKPPKTILKHDAEMITQYYGFNTKQKPFDNIKVRQALNYAIDREKIVTDILQGQAICAGIYGITPNSFAGYDTRRIIGYTLDVEKAKALLAEAGYPNGVGFPSTAILLNTGSSRNGNVVMEIQKQLRENLNINVSFDALPNNKKQDLQNHGKMSIYRNAWVADYSSPESFLTLFYGNGVPADNYENSYPNCSRYQSAEYDNYFVKGRNASVKDTSYAYFMKAEQVLMNDAVVIPLWYEGAYRLLNNKVKNLDLNPMRYYDLRKVYKDK